MGLTENVEKTRRDELCELGTSSDELESVQDSMYLMSSVRTENGITHEIKRSIILD